MLYWIVPFVIINVVNATTKTPTIYIELIDSNKLAKMFENPPKFLPLKRQASNLARQASLSDSTASLHKTNDKNNINPHINNIQSLFSKNKELDMKLENQENRKREKVGKRLLLGTCLKEGKTELAMMHALMKARQRRMNHSIVPLAEAGEDFIKTLYRNDLDASKNPSVFVDLLATEGVNLGEVELPQPQSSLPMPPVFNIPSSHGYLDNKPYPVYQEYPIPSFYWPSQDFRPFQSMEPSTRLFKRYENLTNPMSDPHRVNKNPYNPYRSNPSNYLPQMRYPTN
ncbi:uncharacterized protein [Rhodnius prolixus]|uniref:uncharacterized protein n=1 Tax=Rhodnius prolixus TaxID=13249 RepID=UPI003D18E6A0